MMQMFMSTFRVTGSAIIELVFLGAVGFVLLKRSIISESGLKTISDLVIGLFLPLFMFSEIVGRFSFSLYPDWWLFPILSFLITAAGYFLGLLFLAADRSLRGNSPEFLSIVSFQNSGYLPLPLIASMLSPQAAREMFIYIFLFLLGFNLTIFSFGVFLLNPKGKQRRFDLKNMFNAPVIATLLALACVLLGINKVLPEVIMKPAGLLGRCAIPLSILVVGGNLAALKTNHSSDIKPLALSLLIKLVILPMVFLGFVILVKPKPLVGLLIILQAAMPPAAFLSVISRNQNQSGRLINQAIFYGHLISIITIPIFLALYG